MLWGKITLRMAKYPITTFLIIYGHVSVTAVVGVC